MFDRLKNAFRSRSATQPAAGPAALAAEAKLRGDAHLKAGDPAMAEQQYRMAIGLDPGEARSHFALGWALREQGLAGSARPFLLKALAIDPGLVDAHYVLGSLLREEGEPNEAISHLRSVLELQPSHRFAQRDLCAALVQAGDLAGAEVLVGELLARSPDVADSYLLAGNVAAQRGRFESALAHFRAATGIEPALAEAHHNAGVALGELDRPAESLAAFESALSAQPDYASARLGRARLLERQGRKAEALDDYAEAARLDPTSTAGHAGRATLLYELGRHDEALASLNQALTIDPDSPDIFRSRAQVLVELGRFQEAEESLERFLSVRKDPLDSVVTAARVYKATGHPERGLALYEAALQIDPERLDLHGAYASLLHSQRRLHEALAAYDRSLAGAERVPEALNNRGLILMDLGRHDEALHSFDEALEISPDFANGHYSRGLCRLTLGEFAGGWQDCEWRWKNDSWLATQVPYGRRTFAVPPWSGREPLDGRTIVLHPEQGFGDTIQFCRFAPVLQAMGARVVLEVQPQLLGLLRDLPGVDHLMAFGDPLPAHDLHSPLMSLPLALGIGTDGIPCREGYLGTADAHLARASAWRDRIGHSSKPRIGLVWSGSRVHQNDLHRSIPLAAFSSLVSDQHAFVSLQNEFRADDENALRAHPEIGVFANELTDFMETAALIANLDLVVCVDTAVAHLAGALGKPVWLLLPANADWRWMRHREDSPWYSGMRLFRQTQLGDWGTVLASVRSELDRFRSNRDDAGGPESLR